MYSLLQRKNTKLENGDIITTDKEKKVAKGIAKSEIKNTLRHEHYKQCLFNETVTLNSMNMIRSKYHELFMDTVVKRDCAVSMINDIGKTQLKVMPLDIIK